MKNKDTCAAAAQFRM
jgi:hypothetical protein